MVELENLSFTYNGNSHVLEDVSLYVKAASKIAIMGPSGAGKTTLLRLIAGLLKPQAGSVRILGMDDFSRKLRSHIGYIPQNLGLVSNQTVILNVLMGALPYTGVISSVLGRFPDQYFSEAKRALELVGISHMLDRKVWELSGGERQRVAIARALVQKPRLLLADEMVSDLDYVKARDIMHLVSGMAEEMGITLIMVHHDLDLVREYSDEVYLMNAGRIVSAMPSEQLNKEILRSMFVATHR